jgi:hypothetical protein
MRDNGIMNGNEIALGSKMSRDDMEKRRRKCVSMCDFIKRRTRSIYLCCVIIFTFSLSFM